MVDSRFRGNDCTWERPCLANDTTTPMCLHLRTGHCLYKLRPRILRVVPTSKFGRENETNNYHFHICVGRSGLRDPDHGPESTTCLCGRTHSCRGPGRFGGSGTDESLSQHPPCHRSSAGRHERYVEGGP